MKSAKIFADTNGLDAAIFQCQVCGNTETFVTSTCCYNACTPGARMVANVRCQECKKTWEVPLIGVPLNTDRSMFLADPFGEDDQGAFR